MSFFQLFVNSLVITDERVRSLAVKGSRLGMQRGPCTFGLCDSSSRRRHHLAYMMIVAVERAFYLRW
jgi:hypothetical protein